MQFARLALNPALQTPDYEHLITPEDLSCPLPDSSTQSQRISDAIRTPRSTQIWSKGKFKNSIRNAIDHWRRHRKEFPRLKNAIEYIVQTHLFITCPPQGTLKRIRARDRSTLYYHPPSNTFAITDPSGNPQTMYRPKEGETYFRQQKAIEETSSSESDNP
ncbi:MAG: hypothetical protein ACO3A2_11870 [Bdellovibrionia bacterium]